MEEPSYAGFPPHLPLPSLSLQWELALPLGQGGWGGRQSLILNRKQADGPSFPLPAKQNQVGLWKLQMRGSQSHESGSLGTGQRGCLTEFKESIRADP